MIYFQLYLNYHKKGGGGKYLYVKVHDYTKLQIDNVI